MWEGSKVMQQDQQLAQVVYTCITYAYFRLHLQQEASSQQIASEQHLLLHVYCYNCFCDLPLANGMQTQL